MKVSGRLKIILILGGFALASATDRAAAQVAVEGGGGGANRPAFAFGGGGGGGTSTSSGSGFRIGPGRRGNDDEARRLRREAMLARREIERAFIEIKRQFLASGEYHDALADVRTASAALRATRQSSLSPLRETIRYREIQLAISKLEAQIDELREDRAASASSLATVARALLERRGELSKLETEALRDDETYNDARYALIDAQGRLSALWKDFEDSVRYDARGVAARERLAAVREQMAALSR